MTGSTIARIGALVFLGVAVTATLVQMTREEDRSSQTRPAFLQDGSTEADPLRMDQRRCQLLGEAARSDADCLATWAETRDRFLGREMPDTARPPIQPQSAE